MKFSITDIDANDPAAMLRAAGLLTALAAACGGNCAGTLPRPVAAPMPPGATLDPADNPAAGVDIQTAPDAFGQNPVEAFANTAGGFVPYIESPETATAQIDPAAIAAALAAAAFGAPGNAPAPIVAPLTPPVGTPPALANGAQTVGGTTPGGVDLDKDGLPWDGRIHAGTKGKNGDGRWKAKRGVDAAVVAAVTAELRAILAVPGPGAGVGIGNLTPDQVAANNYVPSPPAAPGNATLPGLPPAPPAPPAPTPTIAPTAPGIIPPPAAGAPTFVSLMTRVGELTAAGKLTEAEANSAVIAVGLASYPQLVSRPDLVPIVSTTLDKILEAKG